MFSISCAVKVNYTEQSLEITAILTAFYTHCQNTWHAQTKMDTQRTTFYLENVLFLNRGNTVQRI